MHIYCTEKLLIPEGSRYGLSQFMSIINRDIVKYIQNRDVQWQVGKSPLFSPIYRLMCEIAYPSSKYEHVFPRAFLTMEWSLVYRGKVIFNPMWNILTGGMIFDGFLTQQDRSRGSRLKHTFSYALQPQEFNGFSREYTVSLSFKITPEAYGGQEIISLFGPV